MTSKQKGDLLEAIVAQLCSGIKNAKTESNIRIPGRSGTERQVDVLITGAIGAFDVIILVDSKNYTEPVDIKDVESLIGMVADVGAHLGVIVCPSGYTAGAKKRAEYSGLQLYQIYDQSLGNTNLFVPIRYIAPRISKYNFCFSGNSAAGHFRMPVEFGRLRFHIDDAVLSVNDIPAYLWNKRMVPQEKGDYRVKVGAIKLTDPQNEKYIQYCDFEVGITVTEDYFLKLFPAAFLKRIDSSGKEHFSLRMDAYSNKQEMLKNGWQYFESMDEMNKAADIPNQPESVRELIVRETYTTFVIEE